MYFCNKLERLSVGSFSSLVLCLRVRLEHTRLKHLSGAPLFPLIMDKKSFIILAPEGNVIKLFST
jgi:hypothetical protein